MRAFIIRCALIALCFDIFVSGKSDAKNADNAKAKGKSSSLAGAGKNYRTSSAGKQRTDKHSSKNRKAEGTTVSKGKGKGEGGTGQAGAVKGQQNIDKTDRQKAADLDKKLNEYQAATEANRLEFVRVTAEIAECRKNKQPTIEWRKQRDELDIELEKIRLRQIKILEELKGHHQGDQNLKSKSPGTKLPGAAAGNNDEDREVVIFRELGILRDRRLDLIEKRDQVEKAYDAAIDDADKKQLGELLDELNKLIWSIDDEMSELIDEIEGSSRLREGIKESSHIIKKSSVSSKRPNVPSSSWNKATSAVSGLASKLMGHGNTENSTLTGGVAKNDKDGSGGMKEVTVSCSDLHDDPKKCKEHEACMSIDVKGDISTMVATSTGNKNGQSIDVAKSQRSKIIQFFAIVTGATEEAYREHVCVLSPEYMAKVIDSDCQVISRSAARMIIRILHSYHILTQIEVDRVNENNFLTDVCRVAAYKYFTAPIGVVALWIYEYNKIKGTPMADAALAAAGPPPTNDKMGLSQWAEKALRNLYASAPWRKLEIYQQYVRAAPQLHKVADDAAQQDQGDKKQDKTQKPNKTT